MGAARNHYNSYSLDTKLRVVQADDPYLFASEGVPRTTALYWIEHSHKFENMETQSNNFYETKIKALELEIEKERVLKELLIKVRQLHPYSFYKKRVKSKSIKKEIIDSIHRAKKFVSLKTCLSTINLSPSTFNRWITFFQNCEITGNKCQKRRSQQLTQEEINTMEKFVVSQRFSHISISSLCYLAQRLGELFCSVDTWYRYTNINEWRTSKPKKFKKIYKEGLRAHSPNEVWHIDVSQIILINGKKYYFQAIIDNYSRYILAWRVTKEISAQNTTELIKKAHENYKALLGDNSSRLIVDGGPENRGAVIEYLSSTNMLRVVAQQDIKFSNSMIESFFNSLKNNYFYHQKIRSKEDIERKMKFYVTQHNNFIPKQHHKGGTPKEIFKNQWNDENINGLKEKRREAVRLRKAANKKPTCRVCK